MQFSSNFISRFTCTSIFFTQTVFVFASTVLSLVLIGFHWYQEGDNILPLKRHSDIAALGEVPSDILGDLT